MKRFFVPALLLAACGDNMHPDLDQQAGTTAGEPIETPETPETPEMPDDGFFAFFLMEPSSCVDHSVRLEGRYGYVDGTPIENGICQYALDDGTVLANTCFATLPFPTPQEVVFTVTDPTTGAVARGPRETVVGPASLEATLAVTSNDLSISWDAHSIYGGVVDAGTVQITITPSENVIVDDPALWSQTVGTVRVTQPGTYTVSVNATITFGDSGSCSTVTETTIAVTCHHDSHAH